MFCLIGQIQPIDVLGDSLLALCMFGLATAALSVVSVAAVAGACLILRPTSRSAVFAVVFATLGLLVAACSGGTPGWSVLVYNLSSESVVLRVSSEEETTDRVVARDTISLAYAGPHRPAGATLERLDPATCTVLWSVELPTRHVAVDIEFGGVLYLSSEGPDGLDTWAIAPPTDACR
jgi:hypothetical protein